MKTALTIAGSDPSGGAGIQADLLTFNAFGLKGLSAVTAITVQTGASVKAVEPVSPRLLKEQIEALFEEYSADAVKIGMLARAGLVDVVRRIVKKRGLKNVVLDTVLSSTSGYRLLDEDGIDALKRLIPLVTVVTPNIEEAAILSGTKLGGIDGMAEAAERIHSLGAPYVLIKGGHLKGAPTDLLYDGKGFLHFKGPRVRGGPKRLHGTGCLLSSAIAAGLAKGRGVAKAVEDGKRYVVEALKRR